VTSTSPSLTSISPFSAQDWQGGTYSLTEEFDYWIDNITGQVPADLQGTLFRNGPGLLEIGGIPLRHPFDGDGMVCAFSFTPDGRVRFRNRYVRTEGYLAEQAAGKILYRGVFGTAKPGGWLANLFDLRIKNIANTQVLFWGGQLLAMWEAARPYHLDPSNLATLGEADLGGALAPGAAFSAHPRIVPGQNGELTRLVNFGIRVALGTTLTIYELDVAGQIVEQFEYGLPGFAFIHDFVVTPHYCIFFQNPVDFNPLPFLFGLRGPGECLNFQPKQPTRIWVIPRHNQGTPICLETDACFVFHHANAYEDTQGEDDLNIVIDSICYNKFPTLAPEETYRQVDFASLPAGQLWRFHLNLSGRQVKRETITERCCEFPTLHPAYVSQPYQQLYMAVAANTEGNAPLQNILHLDLKTGEQKQWSAAPKGFVGEPVFVPKGLRLGDHACQQTGNETDGWLLTLVYDAAHNRSDLVILDAAALDCGPIARLHLRHPVPYGLHGSFTPQCF
jgi:all-trans-8'-apo-beta-carotenal 15,15'-oxygenase